MVVATYARVSSDEQRLRESISTQLEFATRYCQLHELSVFRVYADDDVSRKLDELDRGYDTKSR